MAKKKFRTITYTSPNQAWTVGGLTKLDFTNFVEVAKDGKRVIIDEFELHFQGSITYAAAGGTPMRAEDWYRIFRSVTVEQKNGVKRYDEIDGASLRIHNYLVMDPKNVREQYDFAVGGPTTLTFSVRVPMRKDWVDEPYDFSMPADVLRQVRIAMAQNADFTGLNTGGDGAVTINSGVYWVTAVCHLESVPKTYAVDQVTVMDWKTQTQTDINCTGRPHDLAVYIPGGGGGVLLTNMTDMFVIDLYEQSQLVYPDLVARYAAEREASPGLVGTVNQSGIHVNPFVPVGSATGGSQPRAIALLLSTGNHPDEGPVRENLTIKSTQTANLGTLRSILRTIVPRDPNLDAAQAAKFGATTMRPHRDPNVKQIAPKDAAYFPAVLQKGGTQ